MTKNVRRSEADTDRLTRIVNEMLEEAKRHPEFNEDTDVLIAGITDMSDGESTVSHYGFEHELQVFSVLMEHAAAIAKLNGANLSVFAGPPLKGGEDS